LIVFARVEASHGHKLFFYGHFVPMRRGGPGRVHRWRQRAMIAEIDTPGLAVWPQVSPGVSISAILRRPVGTAGLDQLRHRRNPLIGIAICRFLRKRRRGSRKFCPCRLGVGHPKTCTSRQARAKFTLCDRCCRKWSRVVWFAPARPEGPESAFRNGLASVKRPPTAARSPKVVKYR
jgi:hypothetical protein